MGDKMLKKLKCEECLKEGTYIENRDKAIFDLGNLVSDIDNIKCRCDIEAVICMRCELLDRLEAVKNDIIDMLEHS